MIETFLFAIFKYVSEGYITNRFSIFKVGLLRNLNPNIDFDSNVTSLRDEQISATHTNIF